MLGYDELIRRTISIEVGMQNSGLGTVLAKNHFIDPTTGVALAAVPCAISAVCHSVLGSFLAALWRTRLPAEREEKDRSGGSERRAAEPP